MLQWSSMALPISAMSAAVVGFEVVVGGGTSEKCIFCCFHRKRKVLIFNLYCDLLFRESFLTVREDDLLFASLVLARLVSHRHILANGLNKIFEHNISLMEICHLLIFDCFQTSMTMYSTVCFPFVFDSH